MSWKINAALAAALFALVALIFLIPMEHDLALMLGLVSMVLALLIVASGTMWSVRWAKRKLRQTKR